MSVADISEKDRKKLANYLNEFLPVPKGSYDNDSEEYWYYLACVLRDESNLGNEFKFDAHFLTKVGDKKNSAEYFLNLLADRKLNLQVFISCLKKINCQEALNFFTRASPPIIKQQSIVGGVEVPFGKTITISVEAECHPGPPIYQWFKDQLYPIVGQTSNTLLLHNANPEDTGYYHCRVTNKFINDPYKGCVFSEYVHVTVGSPNIVNSNPTVRQEIGSRLSATPADLPRITLHPSPVTAALGSQVNLECKADGAICYDWFKNEKPFKSKQRNSVLVFESLSKDDVGKYYCEAVNDHGRTKSKSTTVDIDCTLVQPQEAQRNIDAIVFDEQPPEKLDVHVGEEVVLTCRAHSTTGDPLEYKWFQGDGDKRQNGPVFKAKTNQILCHTRLKIYCRVSLKKDLHIGAQSRTTSLTVHTVWFTKQPQSLSRAWLGEKAQLSCSAEGVGNIEYIWLKGSTKEGRFDPLAKKSSQTGVLYFNRLQQKDWGYYQCQAANSSGFVTSETVSVRPTIPPRKQKNSFKVPVIRVLKQPWSQVVKEGGRFRLLFEAVCTEPVPLRYQWYYCGKKIHGATDSKFVREPVRDDDCGPYYCEVKCPSNVAVQPVVSKPARIELAYEKPDDSKPVIVGKSGGQIDQMAGEEFYLTKKEERYAREKIALLIGNQNYQCDDLNDLRSPENDIRLLGNLLESKLGFKVISLLDLTQNEMMQAMEIFYEMLAISGVYALFYYSGHGFKSATRRNFLIPVDACVPLRYEHNIDVEGVTNQMRLKHSRAIVVLDCCRVEASVEESMPSGEFGSLQSNPEAKNDTMSVANYVLITSTQDGNPAYDGVATEASAATTPTTHSRSLSSGQQEARFPCSNFNIAFREALETKSKLYDVFTYVLKRVAKLESRSTTRVGQRPHYSGSLLDDDITLHDDFFLDNNDNEPALEKILKLHEDIHYVPETVLIEGAEQLGELSDLAQLQLSFSYDFTNVLCVHTRMHLLHRDKTSKARIEFDMGFFEEQNVKGVQTECDFERPLEDSDVAGQGETPQIVTTMIRISNIQRLEAKVLQLLLTLSLYSEGKQMETKITYNFPKRPLFANRQ